MQLLVRSLDKGVGEWQQRLTKSCASLIAGLLLPQDKTKSNFEESKDNSNFKSE